MRSLVDGYLMPGVFGVQQIIQKTKSLQPTTEYDNYLPVVKDLYIEHHSGHLM